jgi:hypothetical protein
VLEEEEIVDPFEEDREKDPEGEEELMREDEEHSILENEHDVISISPIVEKMKGEEEENSTGSIELNVVSLIIKIPVETFTREK